MVWEHYPCRYRLDNSIHYLIWRTAAADNSDGVVSEGSGQVPICSRRDELEKYARDNGLNLLIGIEPPILHDLDAIAHWLKLKKMKRARQVDCVSLLSAWNLFDDVSNSIGGHFDPDKAQTQKIYDKIFWGNNLPALTPEGRWYVPLWSGLELRIIHEVMSQGLAMFRAVTKT